jgi:hypothetical protein
MSKFKGNYKGEKNTKSDETSKFRSFLLEVSPPLQSRYPIIDSIFLSYWSNIMPLHFCKKKKKKKSVK